MGTYFSLSLLSEGRENGSISCDDLFCVLGVHDVLYTVYL